MPVSRLRAALVALAATTGAVSCDGGASTGPPPTPVALEIVAPDTVLDRGTPLQLSARLWSAAGEPITAPSVAWVTADPSTATVTAGGAVSGVAIGYVDLVATSAGFADTARLRVRDPAVTLDLARLRFRDGTVDATRDLGGAARFDDTMADGPGDETGLFLQNTGVGRDTSLTLVLSGALESVRIPVTPWPLDGGQRAGAAALLRMGDVADGDVVYHASVAAGWIELDVVAPPAPGWRMGEARGFLHLPLVRLAPDPAGRPVLTSDTMLVHANVRLRLQHVLSAHVVVTMLGGPVEGTSLLSNAMADEDGYGGWLFGWQVDFDGTGSGAARWEASQELRMVDPGVGVFDVPRFTGPQFGEPDLWPVRFSSIFYRDDARVALVSDGTVTVTRWIAPSLEDYGQLEGTLDGRFELWQDLESPSGDTIAARSVFAVALPPIAGLPAAPPAADEAAVPARAWPELPRRSSDR